jgi:hypothetical protein
VNSWLDAPRKEGSELSERWKETLRKGFLPRVSPGNRRVTSRFDPGFFLWEIQSEPFDALVAFAVHDGGKHQPVAYERRGRKLESIRHFDFSKIAA